MEKIKQLGKYQKFILVVISCMVIVFTILYAIAISREGFAYQDAILVPYQDNGNTIYSGKIQGKQASFIVSKDKIVEFHYGDKGYGPYTAKEDATAIPKDSNMKQGLTGIELCCDGKVFFRGGVMRIQDYLWLCNEDGSTANIDIIVTSSHGIKKDEKGNIIDPMEPSAATILDLMAGPKLSHKGEWIIWLVGVFICFMTAITIIFPDELFRWHLAFQVRDVESVEPSDWEIVSRYISWTLLPIVVFAFFIWGLQ